MSRDVSNRKLRAGIVGGGRGSFIGAVHHVAVELDGEAEVVAGAMSTDPQTAAASAKAWYLDRSYDDYKEMAKAEAGRPDGIALLSVMSFSANCDAIRASACPTSSAGSQGRR